MTLMYQSYLLYSFIGIVLWKVFGGKVDHDGL